MDKFRNSLHHSERKYGDANDYKLVNNNRPLMKLNKRKVYTSKSKPAETGGSTKPVASFAMVAMAIFVMLM